LAVAPAWPHWHISRGNCREGRLVTARKPTLALSRSLAARARARIAELDQEIERLRRTDEAIVVATGGGTSARMPAMGRAHKAVEAGGVSAA
jgi:hypothetical protein